MTAGGSVKIMAGSMAGSSEGGKTPPLLRSGAASSTLLLLFSQSCSTSASPNHSLVKVPLQSLLQPPREHSQPSRRAGEMQVADGAQQQPLAAGGSAEKDKTTPGRSSSRTITDTVVGEWREAQLLRLA